MYNKRMYIYIMFMYIYIIHNMFRCMFTTYDLKITNAVQGHLKRCFFPHEKRCHFPSIQSLRYEKLAPGRSDMAYQPTAKNSNTRNTPKGFKKKPFLVLHNTTLRVLFLLWFSDFHGKLIQKQTWEKTNEEEEEVKQEGVFVTPLKISMEHKNRWKKNIFQSSILIFQGLHFLWLVIYTPPFETALMVHPQRVWPWSPRHSWKGPNSWRGRCVKSSCGLQGQWGVPQHGIQMVSLTWIGALPW